MQWRNKTLGNHKLEHQARTTNLSVSTVDKKEYYSILVFLAEFLTWKFHTWSCWKNTVPFLKRNNTYDKEGQLDIRHEAAYSGKINWMEQKE